MNNDISNFEEYKEKHQVTFIKSSTFQEYFFYLLNRSGLSSPELYRSVNMSKQTYSNIISNKVVPTLNNAIKLAIGLKANNEECKYLLMKTGYTLSSNSTFSLLIRYCIENKIFDYIKIN